MVSPYRSLSAERVAGDYFLLVHAASVVCVESESVRYVGEALSWARAPPPRRKNFLMRPSRRTHGP